MRLAARPTAPWLSLTAASFLALAANGAFWRSLLAAVPADSPANLAFLASTALVLVALLNLAFLLLGLCRAQKPVLIAALLIAAVCAHFMGAFGVVIDSELIRSAAEADAGELRDLLGLRFWLDVAVLGILPSLLVALVPLRALPLRRELAIRFAAAGASLLLCLGLVGAQFKQFAGVGREHGQLRRMLNPTGPIGAALRLALEDGGSRGELLRVGLDARRPAGVARRERRSLVVLVVGETARASNFSLNGYPRPTNPRLARQPVISFPRVESCGTATATSLPCMFSASGRAGFDREQGVRQENALDVLRRAGVGVLWRDNNSGCKHVCERIPSEDRRALSVPGLCSDGECLDAVLLEGLQARIDAEPGDALLVLHQQGSHGPAYHRRSPREHKRFLPECTAPDLGECSRSEIVNAYDNSIVYTDWFLSRVIALLEANQEHFASAMLYVSDHGESLGENGIYLHGWPRLIAPDEQIHVPMLLWLSRDMPAQLGLDADCLAQGRAAPRSHDALFHSLLGLFDVSTAAYRPELDLLAGCRARGAGEGFSASASRSRRPS